MTGVKTSCVVVTYVTGFRSYYLTNVETNVTVSDVVKNPPRGKWGTFLVREREARGWTQETAFDALRSGLGLGPKSRSSYVGLERGSKLPDREQREYLVQFYGAEPADVPESPSEQATLIAALTRQAEAMEALVGELRMARTTQDARDEVLVRLVAALAPQARRDEDGRDVRAGKPR